MSFPLDIIQDILLRLPAKSLCRFRCVSKGWQSLISNPEFIKTHFNRSNIEKLILLSNHPYLYSIDFVNKSSLRNDSIVAKKLRFFPSHIWWDDVIGVCNGLVLATAIEKSCYAYLINPTTQQHIKVSPPPDQPDHNCDIHQVCGLGYDSLKDDYKVVVIAYYKNEQGMRFCDKFVNVYSLTSNSWRVIIPPKDHAVCTSMPGVYLNGCLHWLCKRVPDSSWVIAAFSLEDEVFKEVQLPSFVNGENAHHVLVIDKLVAVNERLCFYACWSDDSTEIWVMEEYGVSKSWMKISILGMGSRIFRVLRLLGDVEVVLEVGREKVVVYNVEAKTWRNVVICGIPCRFLVLASYVESLVSLNYGNAAQG